MNHASDIVEQLNDNQAIAMIKRLNDRIFSNIDFDKLMKHIGEPKVSNEILALDDDVFDAELNATDSVRVARQILTSLAKDEGTAGLIEDTWKELEKDDSMFIIEAILAVGLVANLTLFMVSTKMELDLGKLKIRKDKVDLDAVKEIMKPVTELAKAASSLSEA